MPKANPKEEPSKKSAEKKPERKIDGATPVKINKVEKKAETEPMKGAAPSPFIWYKQWWVYAAAGAVLLIVVGIGWMTFGKQSSTSNTNSTDGEVANVNAYVPTSFDLTGQDASTAGHFYPVAIMIDNSSAARPQSGLQTASVVYEALVEGGITRFMAVFDHGEYDQMGPVRSARPYFLQWLAEYDAAYAHAGGSPEALTSIRRDRVHDINGIGNAAQAFFRDKSRPAPHNLYTKLISMLVWLKANHLDTATPKYTAWTIDTTLPETGTAAKKVTMYFAGTAKSSQVVYDYDTTKQLWMRSSAGVAHQDRLTKAQIGVTNVIVQRISSKISIGEKGRLTMTVTGTGTAKLFQQGMVYDVRWSKPDPNTRTNFTYTDGSPVTFLPGNTWIEVLPEDRTLTVQ